MFQFMTNQLYYENNDWKYETDEKWKKYAWKFIKWTEKGLKSLTKKKELDTDRWSVGQAIDLLDQPFNLFSTPNATSMCRPTHIHMMWLDNTWSLAIEL